MSNQSNDIEWLKAELSKAESELANAQAADREAEAALTAAKVRLREARAVFDQRWRAVQLAKPLAPRLQDQLRFLLGKSVVWFGQDDLDDMNALVRLGLCVCVDRHNGRARYLITDLGANKIAEWSKVRDVAE